MTTLTTKSMDATIKEWMDGPYGESLKREYGADHPPIERYIRCSMTAAGWTVEPGIEWREGDDFDAITRRLQSIALTIAERSEGNPMAASRHGESMIALRWPGRAYFIEIHDAECLRWTQSYQPYGLPRHR